MARFDSARIGPHLSNEHAPSDLQTAALWGPIWGRALSIELGPSRAARFVSLGPTKLPTEASLPEGRLWAALGAGKARTQARHLN